MDKTNSSIDDINSSERLSWINSDLYNLQENVSHFQIDRNPNCNVKTNSSIVVHNQEYLNESKSSKITCKPPSVVDPNIQQNWINHNSNSIAHVSQGKAFFVLHIKKSNFPIRKMNVLGFKSHYNPHKGVNHTIVLLSRIRVLLHSISDNTAGTTSNSSAAGSTFSKVPMQYASSLSGRCFVLVFYIFYKIFGLCIYSYI